MNAKAEKSRLGELLLDMRLVDSDTLQAALADQRTTGKRLPTVLAQRRVLDEERLTKAVAARLGLEAVSVSSHKIHERVLNLVPHEVAKKYGLLPIAIKRTQQAEVLYLVMVDPLNTEALGEVQRLTGRQVRVLMATASELDQCIETQYQNLEAKRAEALSARPNRAVASRPPIVTGTPSSTGSTPPPGATLPAVRTAPRRAVSVPAAPRPRGPSAVARPSAPPPGRTPAPTTRPSPARPSEPRAVRPEPSRPGEVRPARPEPSRPGEVRPARAEPSRPGEVRPARPEPSRPGEIRPARPEPPRPGDIRATRPEGTGEARRPDGSRPGEVRPAPRSSEPKPSGTRPAVEAPPTSPPAFPPPPSGPAVPPPFARSTGSAPPPASASPFGAVDPVPSTDPLMAPPAPVRQSGGSLDLANPATLIDTARPPEIEGLSQKLGVSSAPVVPSDLDPPDAVATRIDADPYSSPPPPPAPLPLSPAGPPPPAAPAPPAASAAKETEPVDWDLGGKDWSARDAWSGLAESASPPAAASVAQPHREVTALDDQWAQATGLDMEMPPGIAEDGPEDIATSQLELSEESKVAMGLSPAATPPAPEIPAPAPLDKRTVASTLELPVELQDEANPFEGPAPGDVPVGLERTGIFPAIDFEAENFEPPDLARGAITDSSPGLSDIPDSEAAVRARFGDQPAPAEDEDAIEAIEEVMLEPLDDEPVELDGGAPAQAPAPPAEPDGEAMPVIEPSSLVSLMDEEAENADTGSAPAPVEAPPPTRVFDEADRAKSPPGPPAAPTSPPAPAERPPSGDNEEPTNPRMEAPAVEPLSAPAEAAPPAAPAAAAAEAPAAKPILPPLSRPPQTDEAPAPAADLSSEEPTPARDTVERSDVLDALDGAFVPHSDPAPAPAPALEAPAVDARPDTPAEGSSEAVAMVEALASGSSLNSAERAQLVLAIGRRLLAKGILTREELLEELGSGD